MEKKNNIDLALYRLQRAREEYETSELLYRENKFLAANNRAYYSIFYAIRAVLAMERVDFKKHKDVLAYFNKNYVKTEIFPRQLGSKIVLASKVREDSDYDEEYKPNSETTSLQIETAKQLIELVQNYLNNKRITKNARLECISRAFFYINFIFILLTAILVLGSRYLYLLCLL